VSRDESEDLPERILIKELSGIKVMIGRSHAYIILSRMSHTGITVAAALCCFMLPLVSSAQDIFTDDTISISAVTVTAPAAVRQTPFTVLKIDSAIISRLNGGDLASLLQSASPLSVKRYGTHGLATVSVRGMSGSHTLVTWNGLTVNTPGTGFSDFAVIPITAASTVKITAGGSDLEDIAGYIGGKIELLTEPVFDAGTEGSVSSSAGSYGDYALSATLRTGGSNVAGRIMMWGNRARNDFRFINSNAPGAASEEHRTNSEAASGGIIADVTYRRERSVLGTHFWYNNSNRQLPGPVTTVQQDFGESQVDRSVKGVVDYSVTNGKLNASISAGGSHDINRYFNETPDLNGDNSSETLMTKAHIGYRFSGIFELVLASGDEYQTAHSLSYDDMERRNIFSTSLAAKVNPMPRLRLLAQVRQSIVSEMKVGPEFTAGASYLLTGNGEHVIKASLTHNTKLPCLNELYWVPGGNSSLMPETATGGETSWSFVKISPSKEKNSLDVTVHASRVSNLIQWIPGESGIWSAENVKSVKVAGVEVRAGTSLRLNEMSITGYLNYALTSSKIAGSDIANDRSAGSQLVYIPLHHMNLNFNGAWKVLRAGITTVWESRRYTVSDNSEWLPASFLADAYLGSDIITGGTGIRADLTVNNLFNTSSESTRNYPMPLRTFKLRLILTFSNHAKSNENTD
jgi:iron complex outermembrane receptor protein